MMSDEDFEESGGSVDASSNEEETEPVFKKRKYENIPSDDTTENAKANKRKHKNDLYMPPTTEELNNLKETENLYNNNLFRLQIEELILEVNIKNKRKKNVSSWLETFKVFLQNIAEFNDILLSDLKAAGKRKPNKDEKWRRKLAKYPQIIKTDRDMSLKFEKPESFEVFGLYENDSLPGPGLQININIKMPKSCFLLKDFLNNRYFCKRYYYLLYIKEQITQAENIATSILVEYHEGNMLLPILNIEPSGCDKTRVKIYVTPSEDYFKPSRFLPDQNNVKQNLFNTNVDDDILKNTPTTLYNSSLCYDVTLSLNNRFIKETLKEQSSCHEAIKLLCIWLTQRELNIGVGSFTEDLVLYFIVYLFAKKKINKYMSSYQVIRNFWNFIATSDLHINPISIGEVSKDVFDSFKQHFPVVFVDKSSCYNVTAFLSLELYNKIRAESQIAVKHLDDSRNTSFQQLFLTKYPFYLQYDLVIDLSGSLPLEDKYSIEEDEKAKFIGYEDLTIVNYISRILKRALGKRFLHFVPRIEVENRGYNINRIFFGVNLNPDEAFNFIELGPPLNDHVAAAEFRQFWGHLSSDRRFRDGSTNVAVHFKTNTIKGKRGIIRKILNFIIEEKLELKFKLYYDDFEEILVSKELVPSYPSGSNEETTLKIIKASDELGKKLRSMQMSLKITGVQGACDTYCYTNIHPPIPTIYETDSYTEIVNSHIIFSTVEPKTVPRFIEPINCVLQLEHSSKWPSDLEALRHIKTSFYLEISKTLESEHNILSHVTPDFIEVLFEGIIFRYRLYVPKEMVLVKRNVTETGLLSYKESSDSFLLDRSLNILPKVVGALKGIQSLYPSYGPGTAIIKRWLRSQLIDNYHFPDIAVDLLNASLYLNNPYEHTNAPQISFLRFLKFISEFDWKLQTVLVNLNDDITKEEIAELESKLQQNREAYQSLYIIMPFDQGLSVFTKQSPTKEVLCRVRELAKSSLNFVSVILTEQNRVGIKELFIPNYEGFNLLIHLNPRVNSRRHQRISLTSSNDRLVLEKHRANAKQIFPVVNFSPVDEYLKTLRENYGKYAMFFHDSYGGNVIGVLWHPKVLGTVDFKVSRVNASMLVGDKLSFNMDAVIEDFYFIGKGIVKMIDKK